MLITLLDCDFTNYHVNPRNIIGCYYHPLDGGCYIDLTDGTQYQVTKDSYMRIIEWMRKDMKDKR